MCYRIISCISVLYWRRQWHPTPVLLPGKSHGWRSLVGCSPWGHEESDTTERLHFHFSPSCIGDYSLGEGEDGEKLIHESLITACLGNGHGTLVVGAYTLGGKRGWFVKS